MAVSNWLSPVFLVAFSTLMSRSASQNVCPSGWIYLESSCYYFSSEAVNWNAAKSACEALESNLAVINSQDEQQAVGNKTDRQWTWIGFYRNPEDKSQFLWVDGSPVNYTSWNGHEPNHLNEECTNIYYSGEYGYTWNDNACSYNNKYVCEISDIDECAVSNGGCSHKCVNTEEGYKCECPDPELSLAPDKKTCQA